MKIALPEAVHASRSERQTTPWSVGVPRFGAKPWLDPHAGTHPAAVGAGAGQKAFVQAEQHRQALIGAGFALQAASPRLYQQRRV